MATAQYVMIDGIPYSPKHRKVKQLGSQNTAMIVTKPAKRVRQSSKPLMNKLEQAWFDNLCAQYPGYPRPRAQAKKYKLANGVWYKPDITATSWPAPYGQTGPSTETAWEVKGPKEMKGIARGMIVIKTAAYQWPEIRFILVWKENGEWKQQRILS